MELTCSKAFSYFLSDFKSDDYRSRGRKMGANRLNGMLSPYPAKDFRGLQGW
jgi:hypothetical protein